MTVSQLFRLFSQSYALECDNELHYIKWYDIGESCKNEQSVALGDNIYFTESDVKKVEVGEYEVTVTLHRTPDYPYEFKFLECTNLGKM